MTNKTMAFSFGHTTQEKLIRHCKTSIRKKQGKKLTFCENNKIAQGYIFLLYTP